LNKLHRTRKDGVGRGKEMGLDQHLSDAAADFARRHAGVYGKGFRDGDDDAYPHEPAHSTPALPAAVHLVYEGDSGEVTERVVTLLTAWRTDEIVYFKARCHLRRALRTFRADHVVELVCLATGEAPDDPAAWIVDHALYEGEHEPDYTPHALRVCRDELALLAYVGGADGNFDEHEVDVAVDYVMMSTEREIDRDRAARYIRRLTPSIADLHDHVHALALHPDRWPRLTRSMRRLVDCDEDVCVEEQIAWSEISDEFSTELASLLSAKGLAVSLELGQQAVASMVATALTVSAASAPA
jgi:hypothetical protein